MTRQKENYMGVVEISRVSVGGEGMYLFDSTTPHRSIFSLTVSHACVDSSTGGDKHIYPEERIVTVDLTAAQLAQMMTTMNYGCGTPCTVRMTERLGMVEKPRNPERKFGDKREMFVKSMKEIADGSNSLLARINELLAKPNLGKKDREELASLHELFKSHFVSNASFAVDQFEKVADGVEAETKANIEAYVAMTVENAGLNALKGMALQSEPTKTIEIE